jgi:glycine cleavage system H protein
MIRFSPSHEWVRIEGSIATVGITSFAKNELGDIVHVQLPRPGQTVRMSQDAVVLESTKAAADVYAPLSGTVIEVNTALQADLNLLNVSPEKEGWLFRVRLSHPEEVQKLLTEEVYRATL